MPRKGDKLVGDVLCPHPHPEDVLIAAGTSICGASAIVATKAVTKAHDDGIYKLPRLDRLSRAPVGLNHRAGNIQYHSRRGHAPERMIKYHRIRRVTRSLLRRLLLRPQQLHKNFCSPCNMIAAEPLRPCAVTGDHRIEYCDVFAQDGLRHLQVVVVKTGTQPGGAVSDLPHKLRDADGANKAADEIEALLGSTSARRAAIA